ncbi:MAG: zinc-ribbon domain-containing protein [Actinomycetota bacterium]|nr:zinc-ribbon domain-containing protein [Actinomycetota bacterium]
MSFCTRCGKEVAEGSIFCHSCGHRLSTITGASEQVTTDDLAAFVGPNWDKYSYKFAKFNESGVDNFRATWHWPAFFVTFWWMLYRKLYGWAVFAFFLTLIPIVGPLLIRIAWAITGNWIYYNHAKKKMLEIKQRHYSPEAQRVAMAASGGVGNAVLILVAVLLSIAIAGIIAAIAIPALMGYKNEAKHRLVLENYHQAIYYVQAQMDQYSYSPAEVTTSAAASLEEKGGQKKNPWDNILPAFVNGEPEKGQVGFTGEYGDNVKEACDNRSSITVEANIEGSGGVNSSKTLSCRGAML